jgi:hypothetical protein
MNIKVGFPGLAVGFHRGLLPEPGDAIGIAAVVDFNLGKPILCDRIYGKVRDAVFDIKPRGWSNRNAFILRGKMLFKPMIQKNPLFGTGSVIGVHISGHTPIIMRKKIHGPIDSLEGRVEIVR